MPCSTAWSCSASARAGAASKASSCRSTPSGTGPRRTGRAGRSSASMPGSRTWPISSPTSSAASPASRRRAEPLPALTPLEIETLQLSLRVGLVSVAASLPFGIAVAWLLARRQFPGKIVVDGLVHLPLVLPPVVVGYGLLVLFGRHGPIGGWLYDVFGVTFAFNWKGAALASGAMAFPLMVRAMRLSLELVDRRLEAAARTLGAGRL